MQDVRTNEHALFMFKLYSRSLPTARSIQLLNDYLGKQMYPGYVCPLCGMARGDEFHIFCRCMHVCTARQQGFEAFIAKIEKFMTKQMGPTQFDEAQANKIMAAYYPQCRYGFRNGCVPAEVEQIIN